MKRFWIWLCIMAALLCGCTPTEIAPSATEVAPGVTVVTTVDELLAALEPGARIQLGEGEFRLNAASDYGQRQGPYYIWKDLGLGEYGLQLQYLEDVTITGSGKDATSLTTDSRFAHVVTLMDCRNVTLSDMTLGHTRMADACDGGVVYLDHSNDITLTGLGLYGCGTDGMYLYGCENITAEDCEIYECSNNGFSLTQNQNVTIRNCTIHSLGKDMPVSSCFSFWNGNYGVTVEDCTIRDNYAYNLILSGDMSHVTFKNTRFTGNQVASSAFSLGSDGIIFDNVTFEDNDVRIWYGYPGVKAHDPQGAPVEFEDAPAEPVEPGVARPVSTGEQKEVRVTTVDEFLKAIAPDTCIILESELLDLSTAKDYGGPVTQYYYWENNHDGPGLVISGVSNLTIKAEGEDVTAHTISAVPRYAQVLTFENCSAITLSGFTAGHTIEPGYCMGGVILFRRSDRLLVENCGLYGCGTVGIQADSSKDLQVVNCDIYECSDGGIWLSMSQQVAISGTTFRLLGGPAFSFYGSSEITLDGEALDGNYTGD